MRLIVRASVVACLFVAAGCSSSTMAPVKGRVMFKGLPVAEANVTFSPAPRFEGDKEPGKPATGFSGADGRFALSTYKPYDGALIGKHRVVVFLDDTNPTKCKHNKRFEVEVKPGTNDLPDIEMDP
jgi:hypothetical protein